MDNIKKLDDYFARAEKKGKQADKGDNAIVLYEAEPWPEPVDGAGVLCDVAEKLQQHMAMREADTYAVALWVAHAHCYNQFTHSPLMAISAPAPECGKSVLLSLVGAMVPRPQATDNMSPAPFSAWQLPTNLRS